MPGGRPTKLTKEMKDAADDYVISSHTFAVSLLPTIEGLALKLHVHRDSLYEWEKDDQEFSDILERLRQVQAEKLIQNSLENRYNATIAKMILSGRHNYVEKASVENTGEQKLIIETRKYGKPADD